MALRLQATFDAVRKEMRTIVSRYGAAECSVVVAAVVLLLARFWRLDSVPPGFHSDEMTMLANSVCLRHTGVDLWGHGWGFSSGGPVNAYGYVIGTPIHYNVVYALWLFIAGDSITAARSLEVVISLVMVACTTGIVYNFLGRRAAVWALALSAISPWTWALSRVAFIHTEFLSMHLFIGVWLLSRHIRRGDDPTTKELIIAGLLFGVSLFSPYSTIPTVLVAVLFSAYLYMRGRLWRPIGMVWACVLATYIPLQVGLSKYTNERIGQMEIFKALEAENSILGKGMKLIQITWDRLAEHLNIDYLVLKGDGNLRQHSGWGGELSWPQILLLALLPVFIYVVYKRASDYRRELQLMCIACVGALGGLLTASMAGEQTHANRSLPAAQFLVLGCVAVAITLAPLKKYLSTACVVLGILFARYYLNDYFTKFAVRSDFYFQSDVRAAGERAQATGDYQGFRGQLPQFMQKYGLLADVSLVYYEAEGSGKGCPGYGK